VNRFCGRSGAGSVPTHGLAPQNLSSDKHVDVCADSDEDRGSTPLASSLRNVMESEGCRAVALGEGGRSIHGTDLLRATVRRASKKMGNFTYVYVLKAKTTRNTSTPGVRMIFEPD
jgi:hypothetical protein